MFHDLNKGFHRAKGSNPTKGAYIANGFTLIEVLVVILIFSVVTVLTYQSFQGLLSLNERMLDSDEKESSLQRAWSIMLTDFMQLNARPVRDILGAYQAAYQVDLPEYAVRFTRGGLVAYSDREALQRVAYSVNAKGDLLRWVWPVLDGSTDIKPISQTLLIGVDSLLVEQLNLFGDYENLWPPLNVSMPLDALPRMIRITLKMQTGHELQRVLPGVSVLDDSLNDKQARDSRFPMFEETEQLKTYSRGI